MYFEPHYDFYEDEFKQKRRMQRTHTFLVYLNDLESKNEGHTHFPNLGLKVAPEKNAALFWSNLDGDSKEDKRTLHGGSPIRKGEKWAINIWITKQL